MEFTERNEPYNTDCSTYPEWYLKVFSAPHCHAWVVSTNLVEIFAVDCKQASRHCRWPATYQPGSEYDQSQINRRQCYSASKICFEESSLWLSSREDSHLGSLRLTWITNDHAVTYGVDDVVTTSTFCVVSNIMTHCLKITSFSSTHDKGD